VFFEEVIRDNLDIGRPDQVSLIFEKSQPPDPGALPHPGHHRGRHPLALRRLQAHQDQAVSQGGPGPPDRNHHQRHP
jgi:hypothetical protein